MSLIYRLVFFIIFFPFIGFSQKDSAWLPLNPKVLYGKLENGLTYYVLNTNTPQDRIELRMVAKAGYFLETPGQLHVAHVVEHIAFGRTKNFSDVPIYLTDRGLKRGIDFWAGTGFSSTNYGISIPKDSVHLFVDGLKILSDWCGGLVIDSMAIQRERLTVLNELGRPGNTGGQIEQRLISDRILLVNPRTIVQSVETFHPNELIKFYHDWYRPDLQSVIIVGDVNTESVVEMIQKFFGSLKSKGKKTNVYLHEIKQTNSGQFIVDSSDTHDQISFEILYRETAGKMLTASDFKRSIAIGLINQMLQNRFSELNRDSNIPCNSCIINYGKVTGYPDARIAGLSAVTTFNKGVDENAIHLGINNLLLAIEQFRRYGFTPSELDDAKKEIYGSKATLGGQELDGSPDQLVKHFLGEYSAPGQEFLKNAMPQWIAAVSEREVQSILNKWMNTIPDVIVKCSVKEQGLIPSPEHFKEWVKDTRKRKIPRYVLVDRNEIFKLKILEKVDITSWKDVKYTKEFQENIGITTLLFQKGIRVILKPFNVTGDNSDRVLMEGFRKGGISKYQGKKYYAASVAPHVVSSSGIKGLKPEILRQILDKTKTNVLGYAVPDYVGFKAETELSGFELMLRMLTQRFEAPIIDDEAFKQNKVFLKQQLASGPVFDSINSFYTTDKICGNCNTVIDSVTIEDIRVTYKELFSEIEGFTFVFTGKFDVAKIEEMLVAYFGAISAGNLASKDVAKESYIKKAKPLEKGVFQVVNTKKDGGTNVNILIFTPTEYSTELSLERAVLKKVLAEILLRKLRTDLGSAYYVLVNDAQLNKEWSRLSISFATAYGDVDLMIKEVWKCINVIKEKGIDNAIFRTSILLQIEELKESQFTHLFWQKSFLSQFLFDVNVKSVEQQIEMINAMSSDTTKKSAQKYFNDVHIHKINL